MPDFMKTAYTADETAKTFTYLAGAIKSANDPVNHPSHYTASENGVECIDAIYAALCQYEDPIDAWLVGQVIKYLWRAPLKGKYKEDISKADFYLRKLNERNKEEQ